MWYKRKPYLLGQIRMEVKKRLPGFRLGIDKDGKIYLRGLLSIKGEDKTAVKRYLIKVVLPDDHPDSVPEVYEMGGKIKKCVDRHFFSDGHACLFGPGEQWKYYPKGMSLSKFIDETVGAFFISQAWFDETGEWPFGERGHGKVGLLQVYKDMLGEDCTAEMAKDFLLLMAKPGISGNETCFCGSGKKLAVCHSRLAREYHAKITPQEARYAYGQLSTDSQNEKFNQ